MAWNKPTSNTVDATSSSHPAGRGKMPRLRRGLLAGVIVVLGVGIAAWLFSNGEATSSSLQKEGRGLIKEVTPAAAPTRARVSREEKPEPPPYWENPTTNGLSPCQILKWKHVRVPPPSHTNMSLVSGPKAKYDIFEYRSETEIAMMLTLEPGTMLVGPLSYGESFKRDFLKSCETPIIINDDDSEFDKQLKRDMIQVKIELRQRMADGEDICKIMADARQEAMRLGQIKDEIMSDAKTLSLEAGSEEELEDIVAAANKMLEEKGIAPIKMNPLMLRNLQRNLRNKK